MTIASQTGRFYVKRWSVTGLLPGVYEGRTQGNFGASCGAREDTTVALKDRVSRAPSHKPASGIGFRKPQQNRPGAVADAYNPSTLGGQGRWIMRSRDRDHPGQQGETLSLLKIQKN